MGRMGVVRRCWEAAEKVRGRRGADRGTAPGGLRVRGRGGVGDATGGGGRDGGAGVGQAGWRAAICWLITAETPSPRMVMP